MMVKTALLCTAVALFINASHALVEFQPGVNLGQVVALTSTTFQTALNDAANPFWLLKFYAPWCGHCKKLAPVLDEVAPKVKGVMSIAAIDCTVEKKLCNDHGVRGYPTLKFSLDGEVHEYAGSRKEKELIAFAEKLSRKEVTEMSTVAAAMEALGTRTDEGVAFLAYHPQVTGNNVDEKLQSSLLTQVFAQVARKQKAYGSFFLLDAKAEDIAANALPEGPFVCRLEKNVTPRCYDKNIPDVNLNDMLQFVREQNVPIVSFLGPHNFNKVGRNGRPLVIGVINAEDAEQVDLVKRELASYAMSGTHADKYYYGFFDGKAFQKFLSQFDVVPEEMPQVFLLDVPNREFWQNATFKLNVNDFLNAVADGSIPKRSTGQTGWKGVVNRLYYAVVEYRPWSVILIVLFLVIIAVLILSVLFPPEDYKPPFKPEAAAAAKDKVKKEESSEAKEPTTEEAESKKDK